ncbi:hypothetical protein NA57DRAFT_70403 [Rhizodiscina lignyota]|uniref:Uncharacterized protein n=1 Tax=Rhizodiscina lignyota TaxID=1504668 RepID=A0A9P4MAZ9_9PEZI|nr:hypothetical protein NA57DRAFT_70403 [Rhizodiscina lignyota]
MPVRVKFVAPRHVERQEDVASERQRHGRRGVPPTVRRTPVDVPVPIRHLRARSTERRTESHPDTGKAGWRKLAFPLNREDHVDLDPNSISPPHPPASSIVPPIRAVRQNREEHTLYWKWPELLEASDRLEGASGIRRVLEDMITLEIDLPEEDDAVKVTWRLLRKHRELWDDVFQFAIGIKSRTGRVYPSLYIGIMRQCFRESRHAVLYWHMRFKEQYYVPQGILKAIVKMIPRDPECWSIFEELYLAEDQRDLYNTLIYLLCCRRQFEKATEWHHLLIQHGDTPKGLYDTLIPYLCRQKEYQMAVEWHYLLIQHGDRPSLALADHPFVKQMEFPGSRRFVFTSTPASPSPSLAALPSHRYSKKPEGSSVIPISNFTHEVMSRIMGHVHNIPPVDISDQFCARLFATQAFPVDFVIMGLSAFGAEWVGPLALRELALRVNSTSGLLEKVQRLREAGISVRECVFTLALVKLATEKRETLYNTLLSTDQHPEVLEDKDTQMRLLESYLQKGNWGDVHWTLYVLRHFHNWAENFEWNALLQHHAEKSDWNQLMEIITEVRQSGTRLTGVSIAHIFRHKLRPRRQGHRPAPVSDYDDTLFLANFLRCLFEDGWPVQPWAWIEITRRLGMTGRWKDLSHMLIWLARNYQLAMSSVPSRTGIVTTAQRRDRQQIWLASTSKLPNSNEQHLLRQFFPPARQGAIIEWGFQTGFKELERWWKMRHTTASSADWKQLMSRSKASTWNPFLFSDLEVPPPDLYPLRGLALLVQLHSLGVYIDQDRVVRALTNRLWQLYAPINGSNVQQNRRAYQINPWTLEQMLFGVQRVLGDMDDGKPVSQGMDNSTERNAKFEQQASIGGNDANRGSATGQDSHDMNIAEVEEGFGNAIVEYVPKRPANTMPRSHEHRETVTSGSEQSEHVIQDPPTYADHNIFPPVLCPQVEAVLKEIKAESPLEPRSIGTPITSPPHSSPSQDDDHRHHASNQTSPSTERARLIRRVKLAMAVFGSRRYMHGRIGARMSLPDWILLVRFWGTPEQKRSRALRGLFSPGVRGVFPLKKGARERLRYIPASTWRELRLGMQKYPDKGHDVG